MAVTVSSENFTANSSSVTIYGVKGAFAHGGTWQIKDVGDADFRPIPLVSVVQQVLDLVQTVKDSGKGNRIAVLEVNPEAAVMLFLDQCISPKDLAGAADDEDGIYIPNVTFVEDILGIRIAKDAEYRFALTDAFGELL